VKNPSRWQPHFLEKIIAPHPQLEITGVGYIALSKHLVMEFMTKAFLVAAILTMTEDVLGQTASAVFDPQTPVTWLGIDFTRAKLIGDEDKLNQGDKIKELVASWNELMIKEASKYNIGDAFNKKNVVTNFSAVVKQNEGLDYMAMLAKNSFEVKMDKDIVRGIVAGYDLQGMTGLGLMLNVESFSKPDNQGVIWMTFINLNTKQVIFTERMTAQPGGFGLRNYWAGAIAGMLKNTKKKDYQAWHKKYADNYTEEVFDGPVISIAATREIIIEPPPAKKTVELENTNKTVDLTTANKSVKPGGKYYALLIGVSKYNDVRLNLDHPVTDAKKMKEVLTHGYNFNPEQTMLLENPSRGEIFAALYKLRNKITPNDNLLIFYAGHGYWDEKIRQGYWWPRDANASDPSNWLSNSDLREQLRGISSAHTLLVSDACFSGGIFRTRDANSIKSASIDYQMLYKLPSRRAITSGTLTAVPDRSVFVEYFLKRLGQNQEKFLPSQMLFNSIRLAIINNSATVPQEGVIAETGDEGGDFIFQKK